MKYTDVVLRNRMLERIKSSEPLDWRDEYLDKPLSDEELTAYIDGLLFVWLPTESEKMDYFVHNYGSLPMNQIITLLSQLKISSQMQQIMAQLYTHIYQLRNELVQPDSALLYLNNMCRNYLESIQSSDANNSNHQTKFVQNLLTGIAQIQLPESDFAQEERSEDV